MDLMLVGGIPYSGKKDLCKKLATFEYFSIDDITEQMGTDQRLLYDNLMKVMPETLMRIGIRSFSGFDALTNLIFPDKEYLDHLIQMAVNIHIAEAIKQTDKIPIIESLLHTKYIRQCFHEAYSDYFDMVGLDYESMKKHLVYLDLGLENSLERFDGKPMPNVETIIITHLDQQIPEKDEYPNVDVVAISGVTEMKEFIQQYV